MSSKVALFRAFIKRLPSDCCSQQSLKHRPNASHWCARCSNRFHYHIKASFWEMFAASDTSEEDSWRCSNGYCSYSIYRKKIDLFAKSVEIVLLQWDSHTYWWIADYSCELCHLTSIFYELLRQLLNLNHLFNNIYAHRPKYARVWMCFSL